MTQKTKSEKIPKSGVKSGVKSRVKTGDKSNGHSLSKNINKLTNRSVQRRKRNDDKTFDVITDRNGDAITQTQSGRIVKVKNIEKDRYELLDKWLDGKDGDSESTEDGEESDYEEEDAPESEDEETDPSMPSEVQTDDEHPNGNHDENVSANLITDHHDRKRKRGNHNNSDENPSKKRRLRSESVEIKIIEDGVFTLDYTPITNGKMGNIPTQSDDEGTAPANTLQSLRKFEPSERELEAKYDAVEITKSINVESNGCADIAVHKKRTKESTKKLAEVDADIRMVPCTTIKSERNSNTITNGHTTSKMRYQYPLQIEEAMPEPDDIGEDSSDNSTGYKVVCRDTYAPATPSKPRSNYTYTPHSKSISTIPSATRLSGRPTQSTLQTTTVFNGQTNEKSKCRMKRSSISKGLNLPSLSMEPVDPKSSQKSKESKNTKPKVESTECGTTSDIPSGRPKAKPSKQSKSKSIKSPTKSPDDSPEDTQNHPFHINRGFACVIEQLENKSKKPIGSFFNKSTFTKHLESSIYDTATPEQIPLIFSDHLASANMVQYAIIDEDSVYHFESPLNLAYLSRFGPFKRLNRNEMMLGIQTPYVYVGQQHTFFPFHREDMNFYAVNHLLWGCDKIWYCIHPKDHAKVLAFVRNQYCQSTYNVGGYDIDWNDCETPLQHKLFWFDPYILLTLGIRVFFIRQKPGDIVITPPGGIHGGLNAGPNLAESINFMSWDVEQCWKPVLGAMLHYMHNYQCAVCTTHAFVDVNRLAKRLRDGGQGSNGHDDGDYEYEMDLNPAKEALDIRKRVPSIDVIAEPLPIIRRSPKFMKYSRPNEFISRSFTWNNREQLRSRYLNSKEHDVFENAMKKGLVYPLWEMKGDGTGDVSHVTTDGTKTVIVTVYPVEYEGEMDHVRDSVVFVPLYLVSYLHDDEKASERVTIDNVLSEFTVAKGDWNCQFDEQSVEAAIKVKLKKLEVQVDVVTFVYRTPVISPKSLRTEDSECALSPRRRKKRRVICDSDSDD